MPQRNWLITGVSKGFGRIRRAVHNRPVHGTKEN
jgi:hypothetical protein